MSRKLILIRHTTVEIATGLCYGQSEVRVSNTYPTELQDLLNNLTALQLCREATCYTSSLQRAKVLATDLHQKVCPNGKFVIVDALREINFGLWEMQPWEKLPTEQTQAWFADYVNVAPPEGESFANLIERVRKFWEVTIASTPQDAILVAHAGVLRAILVVALGLPATLAFHFNFGYGSVSQLLQYPTHWQVDFLNKTKPY